MKIDDFPFDEIAEQANSDEELIDLIYGYTDSDSVTNQVLLVYYRLGVIDSNIIRGHDNARHWLIHGVHHREDGPAIIDGDGAKYWYINDRLHREDGPAIIHPNGPNQWYIKGGQLTEEEFNAR